ncbi:FBB18 [Auxenochlorella protothecoides x Auxenochlorella symbiontica]
MVKLRVKCHGRPELPYEASVWENAGAALRSIVALLNTAAPGDEARISPTKSQPVHPPALPDPKRETGPIASAPIDPDAVHLFFAGKALDPALPLSTALGTNEKTSAIVWVHPKASGRPPREPALGPDEQKQLMAWQFARQEAQRAAEEAAEPEDGGLGWADPGTLHCSLQGLTAVRLR